MLNSYIINNGGSAIFPNMKTGEKIKQIRLEKKLSREKLAPKMNTTGHTIYRLERGEMQITEEWLSRFAKALDCEIFDLIDINTKNKSSLLDPKRLTLTQEAVEGIIKERNLKLTREQIANLLARVYNESLKLELEGEHIPANVIARLLVNNS